MSMGTWLYADCGICYLSGDWSVENLFPFPGLICLKLLELIADRLLSILHYTK